MKNTKCPMWICSFRDLAVVCSISALASAAAAGGGAPLEDPIPGPLATGSVHVDLQPVATGLTAPNWGTHAPGVAGRLFVADQDGVIWNIDLSAGTKSVFLDASGLLVELGAFGPNSFDERGLLGVAFHPDYQMNGLLYTYTSEPVDGAADYSTIPSGETANHQAVIREWSVPDPSDADATVDPMGSREILRVDEPQFNHNGGALAFDLTSNLLIAFGDGGSADDQGVGHGANGNGQDPTNPLGTLLRIDPLGSNSANGSYGIPVDNPFVGQAGMLDEIFAYGFRNPFRFSVDSQTGEIFAGDVGQNDIEEVDRVISGGNYGWNFKEGSFFFDPNGSMNGFVTDVDPGVPAGLIDPIAEYDHDEGISVIGGFVYRGSEIPMLAGRYVFGEFAQTFSNDGRLFYLDASETIKEAPMADGGAVGFSVLGFGRDGAGELYVLVNSTGVPFGDTGMVMRIGLKPGDLDGSGDVNASDLASLLGNWGTSDPVADIDDDGVVGASDLAALLGNWG